MAIYVFRHLAAVILLLAAYKLYQLIYENNSSQWQQQCTSDYDRCPQCFAQPNDAVDTCCSTIFNGIEFYATIDSTINAMFGSRKLQYGHIVNEPVILKYPSNMDKLHQLEMELCNMASNDHDTVACTLSEMNRMNVAISKDLEQIFMNSKRYDGLQLCPNSPAKHFIETFNVANLEPAHFWILSNVSPETILFDALSRAKVGAAVPKVHRTCGFTTVMDNKGSSLYNFFDRSFRDRVYMAKQMLEYAIEFSHGYKGNR